MLLTEAIKTMVNVKKGTFTPVSYKSELPVKAKYKNDISIVKYSVGMGRFGISYKNLPSVKSQDKKFSKKNANEVWVLKDIIKYNKNTGKFYLVVYTVNATNAKTKSVYFVKNKTTGSLKIVRDKNEITEYVIPSYFKPSSEKKELFCVNLDNVNCVGK